MVLVPAVTGLLHPVFADASHAPILIDGNDAFTSDNGVTGGSGSNNDPYMISGWTISTGDYAIKIANTTAYFIITDDTIRLNCNPDCLHGGGAFNGIMLMSIENGQIQSSHIRVASQGIRVESSDNFLITGNDVSGDDGGIRVADSDNFQITSNSVTSKDGEVISLYMTSSFDVSSNNLGESGPFNIKGSYLSDATIIGNTGGSEDGIALDNFARLLISQNSVKGHGAISARSCGDLTIDSNRATGHEVGIAVADCDNVLISNNNASTLDPFTGKGGGDGIFVADSTDTTVTSNTVSYNNVGVMLSNGATGNAINGNVISNNNCGIGTDSSTIDQNYIADNTFAGNAQDSCGT